MRIENFIGVFSVFLAIVINSCNGASSYLSGKHGKFWIKKNTPINPEHDFRYGIAFLSNGTGIFYSQHYETERLYQPGLFDATPNKIIDCMFLWTIKRDTLMMIQQGGNNTMKYKIAGVDNMQLLLVNNNDTFKYNFVREIE